MKILIIGAGKMGSWLVESLCLEHDVAVYDKNKEKLKYFFNTRKILTPKQAGKFEPDMLINAVDLKFTIEAFSEFIKYIPDNCIIADIASVKNGLKHYYLNSGRKFVSTHPMFGPTFTDIRHLKEESAIIISESCEEGKEFFRNFYKSFGLSVLEYNFEKHDKTIAYSLSVPFSSTLIFAACMKKQEAPGTTFRKHMRIAHGLMSEDNYLLSEILLNPYTLEQVEKIQSELDMLIKMIKCKDTVGMHEFFKMIRQNIS
ncbi:prephenate dehydrogenase/arogenate dehydrogenase family protein [Bacteroidota bacterium]